VEAGSVILKTKMAFELTMVVHTVYVYEITLKDNSIIQPH